MEFKYTYKFSERAAEDLEEILRYIAEDLCNKSAAADLGRKIFENIDTIRVFPETGLALNNELVSDKAVRRVVIDNYVLYYKANEANKTIEIVRIVYGKMNLEEIYRCI